MSWDKFTAILGFLLLAFPYVWEVTNDKDGDAHISKAELFKAYKVLSKTVDVIARVIFTIAAALFNYLVNDVPIFKSIFLAFAIHFFAFDYTIAYILIKRGIVSGHWFSFLGSKGMDNFYYWRTMDPVGRLIVRALVLALALAIYFYQPK